jgi:hypothetical protein
MSGGLFTQVPGRGILGSPYLADAGDLCEVLEGEREQVAAQLAYLIRTGRNK